MLSTNAAQPLSSAGRLAFPRRLSVIFRGCASTCRHSLKRRLGRVPVRQALPHWRAASRNEILNPGWSARRRTLETKSREASVFQMAKCQMSDGLFPVAHSRQRLLRHFFIVEVKNLAPDNLVVLVPFAGNQHQIISPRLLDGVMDRFPAIRNLFVRLAGPGNALFGVTQNLIWIFCPGIIGSQDDHVA